MNNPDPLGVHPLDRLLDKLNTPVQQPYVGMIHWCQEVYMLVCRFSCHFPTAQDMDRVVDTIQESFFAIRKPDEELRCEVNGSRVLIEVTHHKDSKTGTILTSRLCNLWSERVSLDSWREALRRTYLEFGESAARQFASAKKLRTLSYFHDDIDNELQELKKCKDFQLG